ncbi:MAG: hypothetical protein V5A18_05450 [Haloarculaceae archaeon]
MSEGPIHVAFVCVQHAGRSQMAHAFARREREQRGLADRVSLVAGGTRPAEHVHPDVVEAMADAGVDLSDRTPREITLEETRDCDYVVTMGCDAGDVCPAGWAGETRDWGLADPHGGTSSACARSVSGSGASLGPLRRARTRPGGRLRPLLRGASATPPFRLDHALARPGRDVGPPRHYRCRLDPTPGYREQFAGYTARYVQGKSE